MVTGLLRAQKEDSYGSYRSLGKCRGFHASPKVKRELICQMETWHKESRQTASSRTEPVYRGPRGRIGITRCSIRATNSHRH